MTVPSFPFLGLVLVGAVAFNLHGALWWRTLVLLVLNLFLIQSFAPNTLMLAPYVGFLALGYLGVLARRRGGRWAAWAFPIAVLVSFVWMKKYLFIPHDLLLSHPYVTIGLSYVFFRVMHLVIDGWEEVPQGGAGLVSYINYTLNFTSLVSGPIQRYEDYRAQEVGRLPLSLLQLGRSIERIVIGFFKVYVVSGLLRNFQLARIADLANHLGQTAQIETMALVIGIYPLYLFFNFSGYTDFVIGCARIFRIELPENFDRPFFAVNFIDFWSRWHITLSQWLKTYVYNPLLLAMMRRVTSASLAPLLGVVAYFCTFFLVGAWHGQTSEFLFFGLLQGGGVSVNKLYQEAMTRGLGRERYRRLGENPAYRAICRGLTFTWFTFTALWFWRTWTQLDGFLHETSSLTVAWAFVMIFATATVVLAALSELATFTDRAGSRTPVLESRYVRTAFATALAVVIVVGSFILSAPAPDVVYKAF